MNKKIDLQIMDLFNELEELIENAPVKGLTRKSISVEKQDLLDIINEIKTLLPDEVKQAVWVNQERHRIVNEAIAEAEQIVNQANQQAQIQAKQGEEFEENLKQQFEDIIESNEVVQRAHQRASEIINKAESYAIEIREGSLQYAEDVISCIEENLVETLDVVRKNKEELKQH